MENSSNDMSALFCGDTGQTGTDGDRWGQYGIVWERKVKKCELNHYMNDDSTHLTSSARLGTGIAWKVDAI